MSKEVILMADVEGLGAEGEVVKVADGYARNYLLPRNLAAPVTEATRRRLETKRREREAQVAKQKESAQELAKQIEALSCTVAVKTGEEGKLFGSVTAANVVDALKAQNITVDRHQVELPDAIRELGVFNVPIKLHPEITATLKMWVVEE